MIAGTAGACGARVRALSITTSAADIVAIAGAAYTKLEGLSRNTLKIGALARSLLLNSRNHRTVLATAAQHSQSLRLQIGRKERLLQKGYVDHGYMQAERQDDGRSEPTVCEKSLDQGFLAMVRSYARGALGAAFKGSTSR
jgi:hypothetical protein